MSNDSDILVFLQQCMGALWKNKKARDYILDRVSIDTLETMPREEILRIVEEAIAIAQGKRT